MKKLFTLLCALLIATSAHAVSISVNSSTVDITAHTKRVQRVNGIASKILLANNLKRVPVEVPIAHGTINASSSPYHKTIKIYTGILPYMDNDDELAYIVAHEIAHSIEGYDGYLKTVAMRANSKKYEYKADQNGIDYMVKTGYNPIAGIIAASKILAEPLWDWGFLSTHPKGSKRMLEMYKYIYVKYPRYLNSEMTKNDYYQQFIREYSKEISKFEQKQKRRDLNKEAI